MRPIHHGLLAAASGALKQKSLSENALAICFAGHLDPRGDPYVRMML
jgi:hypothetical protein